MSIVGTFNILQHLDGLFVHLPEAFLENFVNDSVGEESSLVCCGSVFEHMEGDRQSKRRQVINGFLFCCSSVQNLVCEEAPLKHH